jgi:hypothetical protein
MLQHRAVPPGPSATGSAQRPSRRRRPAGTADRQHPHRQPRCQRQRNMGTHLKPLLGRTSSSSLRHFHCCTAVLRGSLRAASASRRQSMAS